MAGWPQIDPDIRRAQTLPGYMYRDAGVHEVILERLFARSWQLISAETQPPESSNHVTPLILLPDSLDEPLLLVRDGQGDLACLSNVCTHRGMLLADSPGSCEGLRCRYHGRTFSLDGTMTGMPEFAEALDFPGPDDHLKSAALERWGPLAFVRLLEGPGFAEVLGPVMAAMSWLPLAEFVFDPGRSRDYEISANWALYCENYLEGFHIPFVHPGLNSTLDWRAYEVHLQDFSSLQVGIASPGEPVFDLPAGHPDHGKAVAAYYWWVFPNLMLNFYPWGLSVNIVEPMGPGRCRVRFQSYVWQAELLDQGAGGPLDAVEMEDEAVVEAVQLGVGSRLYRRGRYSPRQEQGTHHFHQKLIAALEGVERPSAGGDGGC